MTKQETIQRLNRCTLESIRCYMGEPSAKYNRCDSWINRFIIAVADDKIPVERFNNFVSVVAYYNANLA